MTSFTDVFSPTISVPPSDYRFASISTAVSLSLHWPYDYTGTGQTIAEVMEVNATAGSLVLTLDSAMRVSNGESILIRNVGSNTFGVANNTGSVITSVAAGVAKFIYLTDNSTIAGSWSVFTYGTGTSAADASTLAGYGLKVTGSTLSQSHGVLTSSAGSVTIDATYRASALCMLGGTSTISLPGAATIGNNFFFMLRNAGSGTVTLQPAGADLIDNNSTLSISPSESLMVVCSGAAWYSVGYGRPPSGSFSQLSYDVTSGSPFTLSTIEATNQLLKFIGTPSGTTTVIAPAVVRVYYLQNTTGFAVNFKTAAGSAVSVPASYNLTVKCNGVDMINAYDITVTGNTPDYVIQSYGVI